MSYAPMQWVAVNIANTATTTAEIDLGRIFDFIQLDVPTVDACSLSMQAARATGGTFRAIKNASWATNIGTGGLMDTFNILGHQFIKLVASTTQTANRTLYVRGIAK